jgi:hypothetical protein
MKRLFVAFALPTLLIVQDAAAKIITQCGASEGYGYYFDGSLINPKGCRVAKGRCRGWRFSAYR